MAWLIQTKNLIFPKFISETKEVNTAGLVNYPYEYIETNLLTDYAEYKTNLKSIKAQIGFKIRGYSKKDTPNYPDSKKTSMHPRSDVAQENYRLIQNTSAIIKMLSYSALIVELNEAGYILRGYDKNTPNKILPNTCKSKIPVINVGGVSAPFVNWEKIIDTM